MIVFAETHDGSLFISLEVTSLHSKTDYNRRKAKSVKQTHGNEAQSNESNSSQNSTANTATIARR